MDYQAQLTLRSRNGKTGTMPVSRTERATCGASCPFQDNGCFGDNGHAAMHWARVSERKTGVGWAAFCGQVAELPAATLWRHNEAGDLPGDGVTIDAAALALLVDANRGKRGFTYTHYDVTDPANAAAVRQANAAGFRVNLSGNNLAHADALAETGCGPVVVALPESVEGRQVLRTPAGRKVVVCPATYRDEVTCKSCGLCALERDAIVGFPAHGRRKDAVTAIAAGRQVRFAVTRNGQALAA